MLTRSPKLNSNSGESWGGRHRHRHPAATAAAVPPPPQPPPPPRSYHELQKLGEDEQGAQGVVYRATCSRGVRIGDQVIAKLLPQKATEVDEHEVRKLKQMFDEVDEDASGDIDMHESFKV